MEQQTALQNVFDCTKAIKIIILLTLIHVEMTDLQRNKQSCGTLLLLKFQLLKSMDTKKKVKVT